MAIVRKRKLLPPDGAIVKADEFVRLQLPSGAAVTLDAWLDASRCSYEELATALQTPSEQILSGEEPAEWQGLLAEILSVRSLEQAARETTGSGTYGDLLQPFISWGVVRAEETLAAIGDLAADRAKVVDSARVILQRRLIDYSSRAITLELHVRKLLGDISGETGRERFRSFANLLCERPRLWQNFFYRYPVLARLLATYSAHWLRNLETTLRSFQQSRSEIVSTIFRTIDPGLLVRIDGSLGDRHAGGREVLRFHFENGAKLMYKPRELTADALFLASADRLNRQGFEPRLKCVSVVVDGDHGWTEFIEHRTVNDEQAIRQFYRRQGAYLALLWILGGTDFHSENLIAFGEFPVMIDLEALFHRRLKILDHYRSVGQWVLDRSVMNTGLLPGWSLADANRDGVDISGLGGREGQFYPHDVEIWEGGDVDDSRLVRRKVAVPVRSNRPSLGTDSIDLVRYEEDLVQGFRDAASVIIQHRDEWSEQIEAFSACEVREVIRPTFIYLKLANAGLHPDYLRDALSQESLFARACNIIRHVPAMRTVVASEMRDLRAGDVPRFASRPGSRVLLHAREGEFENFFEDTAIEECSERLRSFDEGEVLRQARIIRGSLAILLRDDIGAARNLREVPYDEREMIAAAAQIGDDLIALAVHSSDEIEWLGLEERSRGQTHFVPTGRDLYSGSSGVGLFFIYLFEITRDQRYADCAKTIADHVGMGLESMPINGGFSGLGSAIYFLHHYAALIGEPSPVSRFVDCLVTQAESIANDNILDIIAGSAGLLLIALNLYNTTDDDRALTIAQAMGEHIVTRQAANERGGAAWRTIPADAPLTGFAHGAAGISYALRRLAQATGNNDFDRAALAGIDYERAVYIPTMGNWPDFRTPTAAMASAPNSIRAAFAWCHGGPGIALGRLKAQQHPDQATLAEVDVVLSQLRDKPIMPQDCLCHGELGNIETLIVAAEKLERPELLDHARRRAQAILATTKGGAWRLRARAELMPGLMTGLAGVGFGFLRVSRPKQVPSVLALDGPPMN
ncbi:MAG: type 2 lanthipeptide synthetase LanM family protein [Thermoanaerobaculia bacterium]